jgi:transcriptional regulator with XRE-family HTH domain
MIVDNIERIRKAKGISKTFIANKLGLSLQGYRYSLSSNSTLDAARIEKISSILDVAPGVFLMTN